MPGFWDAGGLLLLAGRASYRRSVDPRRWRTGTEVVASALGARRSTCMRRASRPSRGLTCSTNLGRLAPLEVARGHSGRRTQGRGGCKITGANAVRRVSGRSRARLARRDLCGAVIRLPALVPSSCGIAVSGARAVGRASRRPMHWDLGQRCIHASMSERSHGLCVYPDSRRERA